MILYVSSGIFRQSWSRHAARQDNSPAAEELVPARVRINDDGAARRRDVAVVRTGDALLARRERGPAIGRGQARGQQARDEDDEGLGNHFVL